MKKLTSVLALSLFLTLGSFAMANATSENTAIEPQMLSEQEMANVTGGATCIDCYGATVYITPSGIEIDCDVIVIYSC